MFAFIASAARTPHVVTVGPSAAYPVVRMRPAQETTVSVLSGTADLLIAGAARRLAAGEEAVIAPRTPYRLVSADKARVSHRYRPEA